MPASLGRIFRRPFLLLATLALLVLPGTHALRALSAVNPVAARANTPPSPSGALPAYPLNHDFATAPTGLGTLPANSGFETPAVAVGTPPANSDFSVPGPAPVGSPPQNDNFATGDFTHWTQIQSWNGLYPAIASDSTHPHYASLVGGSGVISAAFTVDAAAQVFSFDAGYLDTNGYSWIQVYVRTGSGYTTRNWGGNFYCASCGAWQTVTLDATPYHGQSVELEFDEYYGTPGLDNVNQDVNIPDYSTSGTVSVQSDGQGGHEAVVGGSSGITTNPFTLDATAQSLTFSLAPVDPSATVQSHVLLRTGATYTSTVDLGFVSIQGGGPGGWQTEKVFVAGYGGQGVELEIDNSVQASFKLQAVGHGWQETPSWSTTGAATEVAGGVSGQALHLPGNTTATSQPFTIAAGEQQLTIARYKGDAAGASFDADLLSGANFATDTPLGHVNEDASQWGTFQVAVGAFAGQQVELRISQYVAGGGGLFDDIGSAGQHLLSDWTINGQAAVAGGSDAHGTYLRGATLTFGGLDLTSSTIQSNAITPIGGTGAEPITLSYEIGQHGADEIQVVWFNAQTGQNWVVYRNDVNSDSGYVATVFPIYASMGATGYFEVTSGGGTLYGIADNVARRALAEPSSQKVGTTVDTSTGTFGFSERDLSLGGPQPLVLARYYNGDATTAGPLGFGWTTSFDTHLYLPSGNVGNVGVVFGSGLEEYFNATGSPPTYTPADARVHDALVQNSDGTYTYTTVPGLAYLFSSAGVLQRVTDRAGNATVFAYTSGLLATVTDPGGRTLSFAYDGTGHLSSVTEPTGDHEQYGYDGNGDLVSATDPNGGVRHYSYSSHRLATVVDQNGKTVVSNQLDDVGRVTQQTDADGKTTTLHYDTPALGVTQVIDANSKSWSYYFDLNHRTTDTVDPLGNVRTTIYDAAGNAQKVVDPANDAYSASFDQSGLVTGTTDPLNQTTQIVYNPQHLPTTVTDALGNTTTNSYDAAGNLLTTTDADGETATFTYDGHGNQLSATDAEGDTTSYTYDARNNRITTTDPLGNTWQYEYDLNGHVIQTTDPLGKVTLTIYDKDGALLRTTDPLGRTTIRVYDAVGHLLDSEDPTTATYVYTYDAAGLNTAIADPANKITQFGFDANRNTTSVTDPLGHTTSYSYDSANRMTGKTDATGASWSWTYDGAGHLATAHDPLSRTTGYGYDAAGHLTLTTLPNGGTVQDSYDALGHKLTETDPLGNVTSYSYDKEGRQRSVTDGNGHTTSYGYDHAGRRTSVTDPLNHTTTYSYDRAGHVLSVTDPTGGVTSYIYDKDGRTLTTTDPMLRTTTNTYDDDGERTSQSDPLGHTTTYAYDADGRQTSVTLPSGAATTTSYNIAALTTTVSDPLHRTTTYAFDAAGELSSTTDPAGHVTSYAYDNGGRQTRVTDALSGTVSYGYDAAGQQTSVTDANGKTTTYTYDALGDPLTTTDPLGHVTTLAYNTAGWATSRTDGRSITATTSYDKVGNITAEASSSGSVAYTYDAANQRQSMTDSTGTTTYSYDAAGRQTLVAAPGGTVGYGHNAAGDRTSTILPGSQTTGYSYDGAGRLQSESDPANHATTYAYDIDGKLTTTTLPNGVVRAVAYDAAGQQTSVSETGPGGLLDSFAYTYDGSGNRATVTTPAGQESYSYDALSRLTSVTYADSTSESFTYDAAGNILTHTAGGQTTTYTYNAGSELTSDGTTSYSYDADGNLTQAGSTSYTWDWQGNLVAIDRSGGAQGQARIALPSTATPTPSSAATKTATPIATRTTTPTPGATTKPASTATPTPKTGGTSGTPTRAQYQAFAQTSPTPTPTPAALHATYQYDGDGVRVGKTVNGTPTSYLWDRAAGLPQLVSDGTSSYQHQQGAITQTTSSVPQYGLQDGLGSLRTLTNASGAAAGSADYSAYGSVRAQSGAASVFGYTGQQTDAETGYSFLRARYYNPATQRFLSADSTIPNAAGTQGYNAYAYTAGNPATFTDPSGHQAAPPAPPPVQAPGPVPPQPPLPDVPPYVPGPGATLTFGSVVARAFATACAAAPGCVALLLQASRVLATNEGGGFTLMDVALIINFAVLVCELDSNSTAFVLPAFDLTPADVLAGAGYGGYTCFQTFQHLIEHITTHGSPGPNTGTSKKPATPQPGPAATATQQAGCPQGQPSDGAGRLRNHVIPLHGISSSPRSYLPKGDGKFFTDDAGTIWDLIQAAVRAGYAKGEQFLRQPNGNCIMHIDLSPIAVGYPNPAPAKAVRPGDPTTSCIAVVINPMGELWTAFPELC